MINMTAEHFLSLLEETQPHIIEWYLDGDCIRGRRYQDDPIDLCPITGVAWYLGYPLRMIDSVDKSVAELGLSTELAARIANAADMLWYGRVTYEEHLRIRQSLLKATGLA
ncbi:MAG: hypothetical protein MN733_17600 [Nitrososphaera sp.]|nr:hypothetical protein [Nitrososphaera sp.]